MNAITVMPHQARSARLEGVPELASALEDGGLVIRF